MSNKYDKSTYIGYLHIQDGGIKIVKGKEDRKILKTRNYILKELMGGLKKKDLSINRLPEYFSALEGKYIRNKMCGSGSNECFEAKERVKKITEKTIKGGMKLYGDKVKNIFEVNAPILYKKFDKKFKIKGGIYKSFNIPISIEHIRSPGSQGRGDDIKSLINVAIRYKKLCDDGDDKCGEPYNDFNKWSETLFDTDYYNNNYEIAISELLKKIATIAWLYEVNTTGGAEEYFKEQQKYKDVCKALINKYSVITPLKKAEIKQIMVGVYQDITNIFPLDGGINPSIDDYLAKKFIEHKK